MKPIKITIGSYTGNYTTASYGFNLVGIAVALAQEGALNTEVPMLWAQSCRVDSNRNFLIHDFLHQTDSTHLFILDEDMEHPPMMPLILAHRNKPVISGLYFQRSDNGQAKPHFYRFVGQSDVETRRGHGQAFNDTYHPMWEEVLTFCAKYAADLPSTDGPVIIGRKSDGKPVDGGLMRIDGAGFGCLLISREAAAALEEPYLRDEPGLNGDLAFFKQCRLKGIEVWGDASVIAAHKHMGSIGLQAFDQWTQQIAAEMQAEAGQQNMTATPNLAAALA